MSTSDAGGEAVPIADPAARTAVDAIEAGDLVALDGLLVAHPSLACRRLDGGAGYFRHPYLLWFVAENPVRRGVLPSNIVEVAARIVRAAVEQCPAALREQVDYALALVCSGRVPRECGVQTALIDALVGFGARPDAAVQAALAHREAAAAARLLEHGATRTLLVAACLGDSADVARRFAAAEPAERRLALAGGALFGRSEAVATLAAHVDDVSAYSPEGFHAHATALHHAVDAGSLDTVRVLVDAGADVSRRDRVHDGTPRDWALHLGRADIATYLEGIRPASHVQEP